MHGSNADARKFQTIISAYKCIDNGENLKTFFNIRSTSFSGIPYTARVDGNFFFSKLKIKQRLISVSSLSKPINKMVLSLFPVLYLMSRQP